MNKKSKINICSYYILPLLKYNTKSFGSDNFVNSYIHEKNIIVKIRDKEILKEYWDLDHYLTDYDKDSFTYIVFKIPETFYDTLDLFIKGKYSHFLEEHKDLIRTYSGLVYLAPSKTIGNVITAKKLAALDRNVDLRKEIENTLNIRLSASAELISIPDEDNFITIK